MPAESGWIRQFQTEDAKACSDLVRACIKLDPLMPSGAREELVRAESPEVMCERARLFYVAVCILAGAVAGVGGIDMNEIRLLFVAPEHQHKGIGGSLLRHLEAMAPPALFADIFVYSSPGAVGFYRVHGYESGGGHVFAVGDKTVPTIFMTKKLRRNDAKS